MLLVILQIIYQTIRTDEVTNTYRAKFVKKINSKALTFEELYKLTMPFSIANESKSSLSAHALGAKLFDNGTTMFMPIHDTNPYPSLMLGLNGYNLMRKCYTFFTHINDKFGHAKMDLDEIQIHVS